MSFWWKVLISLKIGFQRRRCESCLLPFATHAWCHCDDMWCHCDDKRPVITIMASSIVWSPKPRFGGALCGETTSHRGLLNLYKGNYEESDGFPHKWPIMRKTLSRHDVTMCVAKILSTMDQLIKSWCNYIIKITRMTGDIRYVYQ